MDEITIKQLSITNGYGMTYKLSSLLFILYYYTSLTKSSAVVYKVNEDIRSTNINDLRFPSNIVFFNTYQMHLGK